MTDELEFIDLKAEKNTVVPPFQSAQGFPAHPSKENLSSLYLSCLQALKDANKARKILRYRMDKKKQVILEIKSSLQLLERDLLLEAEVRQSLHIMNEKLLRALQEMDGVVDDLDRVVGDSQKIQRSRLVPLIERLKALFASWRELKLRWSIAIRDKAETDHKGKKDG